MKLAIALLMTAAAAVSLHYVPTEMALPAIILVGWLGQSILTSLDAPQYED